MSVRRRVIAAFAAVSSAAALAAVPAAHAAGPTVTDGVANSFDGTPIVYSFIKPDGASPTSQVPVILMTHGWGGTRPTVADSTVQRLLSEGYAVLTWDSRGFGDSGGEAETDSQTYEVRDTQALIDIAGADADIVKDGPGDPRMGMIGGSYAGGIQLEVASADNRVDAIVPQIPWNNLVDSLKPGGVLKLGWDELLYAAGAAAAAKDGLDSPAGPQTGIYAPEIHRSEVEGLALNDWTGSTQDFFDARSPMHYINGATLGQRVLPGIHAAVLDEQGVSDTLFDLNQGIANVTQAAANHAPVKLIAFCGGHAANLSCKPAGNGAVLLDRAVDWFARYVKHDEGIDTGKAFEYQTQDGAFHSIHAVPTATVATAEGDATLVNQFVPTNPGTPGLGTVVAANADAAPTTVRLPLSVADGTTTLLGVPNVTYSYTGLGVEAYVFAKLVDVAPDGTALAVDDQVTPIKLTDLSPVNTHTVTVALNAVAWNVEPGHKLSLELTTTSSNFSSSRTPSGVLLHATLSVPGV